MALRTKTRSTPADPDLAATGSWFRRRSKSPTTGPAPRPRIPAATDLRRDGRRRRCQGRRRVKHAADGTPPFRQVFAAWAEKIRKCGNPSRPRLPHTLPHASEPRAPAGFSALATCNKEVGRNQHSHAVHIGFRCVSSQRAAACEKLEDEERGLRGPSSSVGRGGPWARDSRPTCAAHPVAPSASAALSVKSGTAWSSKLGLVSPPPPPVHERVAFAATQRHGCIMWSGGCARLTRTGQPGRLPL